GPRCVLRALQGVPPRRLLRQTARRLQAEDGDGLQEAYRGLRDARQAQEARRVRRVPADYRAHTCRAPNARFARVLRSRDSGEAGGAGPRASGGAGRGPADAKLRSPAPAARAQDRADPATALLASACGCDHAAAACAEHRRAPRARARPFATADELDLAA